MSPLGGILWRTSQNTIEVILIQINRPRILQFSQEILISNNLWEITGCVLSSQLICQPYRKPPGWNSFNIISWCLRCFFLGRWSFWLLWSTEKRHALSSNNRNFWHFHFVYPAILDRSMFMNPQHSTADATIPSLLVVRQWRSLVLNFFNTVRPMLGLAPGYYCVGNGTKWCCAQTVGTRYVDIFTFNKPTIWSLYFTVVLAT